MLIISFGGLKPTSWHPHYAVLLYDRAALAWTKSINKRSLRNEKLKPNGASETEEQWKERLKIKHEKDRARKRTIKLQEEKKRSSETVDNEKQRLDTLKRLKRGDEKLVLCEKACKTCSLVFQDSVEIWPPFSVSYSGHIDYVYVHIRGATFLRSFNISAVRVELGINFTRT